MKGAKDEYTILVADDDDDLSWTYSALLEKSGFKVERVRDGHGAMDFISRHSPDLLILDYVLPNMDGLEVLRHLEKRRLSFPIIFITAFGTISSAVEAMRGGAYDYLTKPIDNQDLLFKVQRALEKHELEEELRSAYNSLGQAQASLLHAEKLASVGRLMAGVTHEILNPLNVISLTLHMVLNNPGTPEEIADEIRVVMEQVNRITKITQNLHYFSRQRQPERHLIDLNETVRRTLEFLEHSLKLNNIELELKLAEHLPPILADQSQLQQVVLNLLINAQDAAADGGLLVLKTCVNQPSLESEERWVELWVEDTGPGIVPERMDNIFDPFFTTKPEGKGTGLGLSICKGIVEAHGGDIRAENAPGGGALFVVRLRAEEEENNKTESVE